MVHGLLVHLYFRTVAIDCVMVMVEGGKNALAYCVVADEDACILLTLYKTKGCGNFHDKRKHFIILSCNSPTPPKYNAIFFDELRLVE